MQPWNLGTLQPLESWNFAIWAFATVEPCNLETLPHDAATWNPTTLDLSCPVTLQPWNPVTLEVWILARQT